ncbi:hypothetical protein SeMB42_g06626 [Synchytrium endobioticum]|nr:hypothetical protein SeMB42_g06626 [Synchytrium endobioticum]
MATPDTLQAQVNNAQKAWAAIGLASWQPSLDAIAHEIVANQKSSLLSRKALADSTKDFRKMPDHLKLDAFRSLLKAYQAEIDSITRRCKTAEAAFMDVYAVLTEAPDPAPVIAAMVESTRALSELPGVQAENKRLRDELDQVNRDAAAARAADVSVHALRQRLATYEARLDDMVADKVLAKETELQAAMDDKVAIYKDTEHALQRQLNSVTAQLASLQATHETLRARLADTNQRSDDDTAASVAEFDIISSDLDRANSRIAILERENELLKRDPSTRGPHRASISEQRIQMQDTEIHKLMTQLQTLQDATKAAQLGASARVHSLEQALASKEQEIDALQREAATRSDYDLVKQELHVLKAIEFPDAAPDTMPLERLLHEKNKRLESELTSLKNVHAETASSLHLSQTQLDQVKRQLHASSKLAQDLEEDLLVLQKSRGSEASAGAPHRPQSDADVLEGLVARTATPETRPGDPSSMIPILAGQRDRYRQKNQELEEQLRDLGVKVQSQTSELESLKSDNLKLYEKLRYTQSMFHSGRASAASSSRDDRRSHYVDVAVQGHNLAVRYGNSGNQDTVTSKYANMYESRLDPFSRFSRAEESRRISNLNPAERATLGLTRLIMHNRWSRFFFIFYSMCLHLLVMAVTYKLSMAEECRHDHERWGLDQKSS